MTPATMIVAGKIVSYEDGILTIKARCDDWYSICKRQIKDVKVQLMDGRRITDKQRRCCYALIKAIADWAGDDTASMKQLLKVEFLATQVEQIGEEIFSLSNAPVSLIAEFERWLVRFVIVNDIPLKFGLLGFVDDTEDYIYSCLINKTCCICGRHSDLHHVDHVGMGRDREEIIHEGMRVLPLCRVHHNEAHERGQASFNEFYHIDSAITLDKTLCRIYGLKHSRKGESK